MYENFKKYTKLEKVESAHEEISNVNINTKVLFSECGGYSFDEGLYRIHTPISSRYWADIVGKYFPKYMGQLIPFAYDWLGRQFV